MQIINESWKRLWNAQEIRILVLVSLSLQFGLVFLSPLRKCTGQKLLKLLLWFFYLFADYVAILALGNVLRRQNEHASSYHGVGLGAFWAPFLLLHLGGPDTITSFSIEDNELWWRHLLGLAIQVIVAFMVLLELVAIPSLRVAAAFVFIAGLVKYSERTWALRSSSMDQLRSSMSQSELFTRLGNVGQHTYKERNKLGDSDILDAYDFYKRTKPLVADLRLSSHELKKCQRYFRSCSSWKAFKLVQIELSFLYDVLHTKAILINGPYGCLWRFVSLGMILSAFVLFLKSEKRGYAKADIIISYVLFWSSLFMELISLLLIIFSDWMIVALEQKEHSILKNLAVIIANVKYCFFSEGSPRWSSSIGQYSLLNISLRDKNTIIRRILGAVKLKTLWDKFIFIHNVPVSNKLEEFLYEQLNSCFRLDNLTFNLQWLKNEKGEKVLQDEECNHLRWTINEKEFDESILMWHIATDLCFHAPGACHGRNNDNNSSHSDREVSLIISNYMVYLLIMQPSMMPDGIGKIRFQDTCAGVKIFYHTKRSGLTEEEVREALLDLHLDMDGNRTWSVLCDARWLANHLNLLEEEKRWRIVSRVWVEMLVHAAINSKTNDHAKQLSQGGEFLTHVYLLLAHLCI